MKDYIFGMEAIESAHVNANDDFKKYTADDGGNHNPYNKKYFDQLNNFSVCNNENRITSIPSPYARMHITDLAFRESVCGNNTAPVGNLRNRTLSKDYLKAMSHCLDIFELLFHADKFDLGEKKITIHKVELISTHSNDDGIQKLLRDENEKENDLYRYVGTLDLFRDEYLSVIRNKINANGVNGYKFDFTSLYLLKYDGKTFASTSPFTGFFAKSDCNLDEANLILEGQTRKLLSSDSKTWKDLNGRDFEFRKFLYLLLKDTNLCAIYDNLFLALKCSFQDGQLEKLDESKFDNEVEYKKFNISNNLLPKLEDKDIYIRPDGLDCSYLKYLLYLYNPVDLTIHKDEYLTTDITQRKFPTKDGNFVSWIGVNDLLSDCLFVLTYDINDNYKIVPYHDKVEKNKEIRRCLLPIKASALAYFDIDKLIDNLTIVKREKNVYVVTLKLNVSGGGNVVLHKEYWENGAEYPNGKVVFGNDMQQFAFGIYPFIKSPYENVSNIYKVLFYNSFEKTYKLKFYKKSKQGVIQPLLTNECYRNKTNDIKKNQNELPINCEYYHLEFAEGLEFAEIEIDNIGTSLIVPNLRDVNCIPGDVNVGIDLGTSNTYIAYSFQPQGVGNKNVVIKEISTHHNDGTEWNELTFMNKKCTQEEHPNAQEKNREDLYLRCSDMEGVVPSDECLDSQLCEFIPSRIETGEGSYSFPIPSVMNFLRIDGERKEYDNPYPLLHCAIPFAYYERGVRQGYQEYYYDVVRSGSEFKWFYKKDEKGNYELDGSAKDCFEAFVSELLFIVRSHLLCKGYDLTRTKILWSYPLSFSPQLVNQYIRTWKDQYIKNINPAIASHLLDQFVIYTNESRSPIFDCLNTDAVDHLVLLLDIGGGSTDVIGYKEKKPSFVSSFGFAGNALYLDSSLNSVESKETMEMTIIKYFVNKQKIFDIQNNEGRSGKAQKISTADSSISTLMNYGFTKAPDDFKTIFDNPGPQFMLLLHNAALIYHIAQLCKNKFPEEVPIAIYLTGNGSKLFYLNNNYEAMIREIFRYVYEDCGGVEKIEEMEISKPLNPKATTVRGALKGYNNGLEINNNANKDCVVLLGDSETVFDYNQGNGGAKVTLDWNVCKENIRKNVYDFIDMFYERVYTNAEPALEKEKVKDAVEHYKNAERLKKPDNGVLSDSLFFQYIALIMQKISRTLYDKYKE